MYHEGLLRSINAPTLPAEEREEYRQLTLTLTLTLTPTLTLALALTLTLTLTACGGEGQIQAAPDRAPRG